MEPDPEAADVARPGFKRALGLYEDLTARLIETVKELDLKNTDRAALKEEIELVKNFQKILLMVLDFESQLSKRKNPGSNERRVPLDLGDARAEIGRRLARLEATRGAG